MGVVLDSFNRFTFFSSHKEQARSTFENKGELSGRKVTLLDTQSSETVNKSSLLSFREKFIARIAPSNSHSNPATIRSAPQTYYEKEYQTVANELNDAIKHYLSQKNDLHTSYMLGYAKDPLLKRYLTASSNGNDHYIGFKKLPSKLSELTNLLNHLLTGHSTSGTLYKAISSKLTANHVLGRLLKNDGFISPHFSVRKQPFPNLIHANNIENGKQSPSQKNIETPNPKAIRRLMKEKQNKIAQQLKERTALNMAAKFSCAIISKRAEAETNSELNVFRPKAKAINEYYIQNHSLEQLEKTEEGLSKDINHLANIISLNLDQLPTKEERKLTLLSKGAKAIIDEALHVLKKNRLSFKDRLLKVFFPKRFDEQQQAKNQLIADLHELKYLRNEITHVSGWNLIDKTEWFQDTVYQLIKKGALPTIQWGPFSTQTDYCKELTKQLSVWAPESRSTFYLPDDHAVSQEL